MALDCIVMPLNTAPQQPADKGGLAGASVTKLEMLNT